jgi:hypothetical protein
LTGIRLAIPIGRLGVSGLKILTGDERVFSAVWWLFVFGLAGLGSSGRSRAAGIGVLAGWFDLPGPAQDLSKVAAGEFSLSAALSYFISVRGRTLTGEPNFVCFRGDSGIAEEARSLTEADGKASVGGIGGSFAAIRILTGDGGRFKSISCVDCWIDPVPNAGASCSCCLVDLALGFLGVFHCGLILQSGSRPSFFARARVKRWGGDAIPPLLSSAAARCWVLDSCSWDREDQSWDLAMQPQDVNKCRTASRPASRFPLSIDYLIAVPQV